MNLVLNNPYRIVGLITGASAKEQNKQINKLKMYLDAEQDPNDDFSFPALGHLNRTVESVTDAASKLNLDSDKMNAALFWFYNGNPITDEPAFDAINEAEIDQAINIWTKLTSNGEVSQRNASAYSNLGTLYLSGILEEKYTYEALLEKGISLKLKFLETDLIKDFKALATDETYKTTNKELQLLFLNQLQSEIEKSGSTTANNLLSIIIKQKFSAKEDFLNVFVQKPIEQIEKKVEEAKKKRKANKSLAVNIGKALFEQTADNLKQLKSILGTSSIKYTSITDKVSDEILQCGIDYFSHYKDSTLDPSSAAIDLFRKAKTIAVGDIIIQRCKENTERLQEWINDKPERDKIQVIETELENIKKIIEAYEDKDKTVANADLLLADTSISLNNLKNVIGSTDELYIVICTRIAQDAQAMCISNINNLQERYANAYNDSSKMVSMLILIDCVNAAIKVSAKIGAMELRQDFRIRYIENRNDLHNLKSKLASFLPSSVGNKSEGSAGGCYIATMAYGDYNHSQVLFLRRFRDEVLDKSAAGKWFIKTYYHFSPKLVEKLKNRKIVNSIIRKFLNHFIKIIK